MKTWDSLLKRWREWKFSDWRAQRQRLELLYEEQKILERDRRERARIAAAFNFRYVSGAKYDKSRTDTMPGDVGDFGRPLEMGYKWMCPNCNQLHDPIKFSMWTGIIYPACCDHREGSRNDDMEDGFNLKRPIGWCGPDGLFRKMLSAGMKPKAGAHDL